MNVIIIDTETTGENPNTGKVCEVAAILYSVTHQTPLVSISTLIRVHENPQQKLNGISPAATGECSSQYAIGMLEWMLGEANFAVAHYAEFDRQWFGIQPLPEVKIPWLCTHSDFEWKRAHKAGMKLIELALAYGVGVNKAHRALTDCDLIAEVFSRQDDLAQMLHRAAQPKAIVEALVSFPQKDLAKDAGFIPIYEGGKFQRWERRMFIDDIARLPFRAKILREV